MNFSNIENDVMELSPFESRYLLMPSFFPDTIKTKKPFNINLISRDFFSKLVGNVLPAQSVFWSYVSSISR